jgi:hypothetical protein
MATLPKVARLIAAALLAAWVAGAAAQLRTIPADARRGRLSHVQDMVVEIDGQRTKLAPGAQIRDGDNRVVLPVAVPPGSLVKYRLDGEGLVRQAWILTPQEAAQPDRR